MSPEQEQPLDDSVSEDEFEDLEPPASEDNEVSGGVKLLHDRNDFPG